MGLDDVAHFFTGPRKGRRSLESKLSILVRDAIPGTCCMLPKRETIVVSEC